MPPLTLAPDRLHRSRIGGLLTAGTLAAGLWSAPARADSSLAGSLQPPPGTGTDATLVEELATTAPAPRLSTVLEARAATSLGVIDHTTLITALPAAGGPLEGSGLKQVRLNTTWSPGASSTGQRLRAGDVNASAMPGLQPLRLLGLATPDAAVDVPHPLDGLGMSAWSALDTVSVVVRDAPTAALPDAATAPTPATRPLAKGRTVVSLAAGRVRRGYGHVSNDYGPTAASGSVRLGASDQLTVEAHAEGGAGVSLAGVGGRLALPAVGVVRGQVATSQGSTGSGTLLGVGAERVSSLLRVTADWSQASRGFRDVASTQGEPLALQTASVAAGLSLERFGALGLGWIQRSAGAFIGNDPNTTGAGFGGTPVTGVLGQPLRLTTAVYTFALPSSLRAYIRGFRDRAIGGDTGLMFNLSIPLGAPVSADARAVRALSASAH